MAEIVHKNAEGVHRPFSNYSHCIEVTNPQKFIFCSGQVPANAAGELLDARDFDAQGKLVFENMKAVLAHSGAEFGDVVKLVTYLCREQDVPAVRDLLAFYFPENPPVNSVCIVKGLTHPDILIEVEATAVL